MEQPCMLHPHQTLRFYCAACDERPLLCIECAYNDRAHADLHASLKEGEKAVQTRILQLKQALERQQEAYRATYADIVQQIEQLCDSGDDAREEVERYIRQCRLNIDTLEKNLLEKIQSKLSFHCKKLEAISDDVQTLYSHANEAASLIKEPQNEGNLQDAIELEKILQQVLNRIRISETSETPGAVAIRFIPETTTDFASGLFLPQTEGHLLEPDWIWLSYENQVPLRGWAPFRAKPMVILPAQMNTHAAENQSALKHPWGICCNPNDGNVYIADEMNHRIVVLHPSQESGPVQYIAELQDKLANPVGIAFDSKGTMAVCEYASHRVQVMRQQQECSNLSFPSESRIMEHDAIMFGSFGADIGQFKNPADVAFDASGRLYVADYNNYRVQVYDFAKDLWEIIPCGTHRIASITAANAHSMIFVPASPQVVLVYDTTQRTLRSVSIGPIRKYAHALSGPGNTLWLSDYERGCVHVYSLDDLQFLKTLARNSDETGMLHHPTNMCWGLDGFLYVCESDQNRVVRF